MSNNDAGSVEWHRRFAVELFNATWDLLEADDRSPADDQAMIAAALASRHHWSMVGEPVNFSVGDWQVSRVFASVGSPFEARRWAETALSWARDHDLGPFYEGYGHEALARAAAVAGDHGAAATHLAEARVLLNAIEDDESRKLLAADLDRLGALIEAGDDSVESSG